MSPSTRRSTRTRISPTRYNPCPAKNCGSNAIISTEKKELITKVMALDRIDSCCICMEDVDSKKNCVTTECGHTFCASCLFRYLEENNTCPLCRVVLRRPVKKTPTLTVDVAESLVAGLTTTAEEIQMLETTARGMYIHIMNESGHNIADHDTAWSNASENIRSRLVGLMCEYQITWGINVCREISQWINYVSTSETNGPLNISEIESVTTFPTQINQLMRNLQASQLAPITQINDVVGDGEDSEDDMPDLVPAVDDYHIFDDIDQTFIGPNNIPTRSYDRQPPPPPRIFTPYDFTHSDGDVINYMFELRTDFEQLEEVHGGVSSARLPQLIGTIEGNSLLPEFPSPSSL